VRGLSPTSQSRGRLSLRGVLLPQVDPAERVVQCWGRGVGLGAAHKLIRPPTLLQSLFPYLWRPVLSDQRKQSCPLIASMPPSPDMPSGTNRAPVVTRPPVTTARMTSARSTPISVQVRWYAISPCASFEVLEEQLRNGTCRSEARTIRCDRGVRLWRPALQVDHHPNP
jgi:hypothetical protein